MVSGSELPVQSPRAILSQTHQFPKAGLARGFRGRREPVKTYPLRDPRALDESQDFQFMQRGSNLALLISN